MFSKLLVAACSSVAALFFFGTGLVWVAEALAGPDLSDPNPLPGSRAVLLMFISVVVTVGLLVLVSAGIWLRGGPWLPVFGMNLGVSVVLLLAAVNGPLTVSPLWVAAIVAGAIAAGSLFLSSHRPHT